MTITEKIRDLLNETSQAVSETARKTGLSRNSLYKIKNGNVYSVSLENAKSICDALGKDFFELVGGETKKIKTLYDGKAMRIPVYSSIPAGIPAASIADVQTDEWEEISERAGLSAEHIGIRVKGDSMVPDIKDKDILIIRIQSDVENGETAIIRINGEEWTVKKVKKTTDGIMLLPTNPAYEPLFYNKQQIEQLPVQIVGKVTEIRRTI